MQIDPMRDLKDIVEIERTMRRIGEASQVNKGIDDYEAGRLVDGPKTLAKLRDKHGIKKYNQKKVHDPISEILHR